MANGWQALFTHSPLRQLWPQAPQLLESEVRSTHAFGHTVCPVHARHPPFTHAAPVAHWALLVHVVAHAFPPQRNGLQVTVEAAGQLPRPSQFAARVAVLSDAPLTQPALRHGVVVTAKVQEATCPLQEAPHGAAPVHAACPVRGAPLTRLHVPASTVETLQNSHEPWQVVLQQTPSAQAPLTHSRAARHACPFAFFGVHVVPTQKLLTQSASTAQLAGLHAVVEPHSTPPGHGAAVAVPHVPLPLQVNAGLSCEPVHRGSAQLVVTGGKRQPPLPLQVPSCPHGAAPGAHFPFDDPPACVGRQSPFARLVSTAAQDMHVPVHAVSQQMLPTQLPSAHSLPRTHEAPLALVGIHVPVIPASAQ